MLTPETLADSHRKTVHSGKQYQENDTTYDSEGSEIHRAWIHDLVINDYLFNDLQFTVCFSPQVSLRL